jgi:hypothetical protein
VTADVEDWHEYFRQIKAARVEAETLEEEHEYELRVIEPSRPATPADVSTSLAGILSSLALCGFWSASQVTVTLLEGQPFKTGPRAGERREDKHLVNVFTHAAHPDRRTASIWYENGSLRSAILRVVPGPERVVRSMKELGEFIIEGGTP